MNNKILGWIFASVSILFLIFAITYQPGGNEEVSTATQTVSKGSHDSSKVNESPSNNSQIKTDNYKYLTGFTFNSSISEGLYSYTTSEKGNQYSVSLNTKAQESSGIHDESYPLERTKTNIGSSQIEYGYNEDFSIEDEVLTPAYSSISFDMTINSISYTGEITNLLSEASKQPLYEILVRLTKSIQVSLE